jgi:hypothetical protein
MAASPSSDVQRLLDRQAILDCIYRYSRGLDRHDDELLASCFHADAIDNHGNWVGGLEDFIAWANHDIHESYAAHTHNITSHFAEIDGDVANAESYVIFILRHKDGTLVKVGGGRYLDRFERRDGEWKIALRRLVLDWRFEADGSVFNTDDRYVHGTWDRSDMDELRAELTVTAARGYAKDQEEHVEGVCCLAVPINDGAVPFAVGISSPSNRFATEEERYLSLMRRAVSATESV